MKITEVEACISSLLVGGSYANGIPIRLNARLGAEGKIQQSRNQHIGGDGTLRGAQKIAEEAARLDNQGICGKTSELARKSDDL